MFDRLVMALGAGALALAAAPMLQAQDAAEPALTVIHAGQLLAAPGEERARSQVSILVRGDRIEAVEDGFVTPDGAEIGRIAPGFAADIVAVNGDPLADIAELLDVDFVMARGIVRKNEE